MSNPATQKVTPKPMSTVTEPRGSRGEMAGGTMASQAATGAMPRDAPSQKWQSAVKRLVSE